jgi:hypothetical protein
MVDPAGDREDGVLDVVAAPDPAGERDERLDGRGVVRCRLVGAVEDRPGPVDDRDSHVRAAEVDGERVPHGRPSLRC